MIRILKYISWKSILTIFLVSFFFHGLLVDSEIGSLSGAIDQRAEINSVAIAESIQNFDVYSIQNNLSYIKGERVGLIELTSNDLVKNGFDKIRVGNIPTDILFGVTKKRTLRVSGLDLGEYSYVIDILRVSNTLIIQNLNAYVFILLIQFCFLFYHVFFSSRVISEMEDLVSKLGKVPVGSLNNERSLSSEVLLQSKVRHIKSDKLLYKSILGLTEALDELIEKEKEYNKNQAFQNVAKQVSHDIRSPLSALNLLASLATTLPEPQRALMRKASQRIDDIANNLLQVGSSQNFTVTHSKPLSSESLYVLISSVVSEKRIQLEESINSTIVFALKKESYGIFSKVIPSEFKRTVSNLLNNAIESLVDGGSVEIKLEKHRHSNLITIQDNGKGMPPELLKKIGREGVTYGKEGTKSGSGLGVYGAKQAIKEWGGKLEYDSNVETGTLATITVPASDPPKSFLKVLRLSKDSSIVILDDDPSIHEVWKIRLSSLKLVHLYSPQELREWMTSHSDINVFFLCDYEYLNFKENGLDLIVEFSLNDKSVLVTSLYEDRSVIDRCNSLDVHLLPKELASLVPLSLHSQNEMVLH